MPSSPAAVVFDVVETLFDLGALADALERAGAGAEALDTLFARLLRDAFALGSVGRYRPFAEVADGALAVVAPALTADRRSEVLGALGSLDVHPDVAPAVERLRVAGVRIAALTNGSADNTVELLRRHGLDDAFEFVADVDEVQVWKPQPEPYRLVTDRLGLAPERVALVAVHAWDVHGARAAGLLTGWASRLEHTFADVFDRPDVMADDLVGVVDGLLALGPD